MRIDEWKINSLVTKQKDIYEVGLTVIISRLWGTWTLDRVIKQKLWQGSHNSGIKIGLQILN